MQSQIFRAAREHCKVTETYKYMNIPSLQSAAVCDLRPFAHSRLRLDQANAAQSRCALSALLLSVERRDTAICRNANSYGGRKSKWRLFADWRRFVCIGSALQQQLGCRRPATQGRNVQRRQCIAKVIDALGHQRRTTVAGLVQQPAHGRHVAHARRFVQRRSLIHRICILAITCAKKSKNRPKPCHKVRQE